MASTNKTTNYQLSQYIGSDKPTYLGDYNSDMLKIDTQMKTNADDIATAISGVETATTTANQANTTANQANTTANSANTTAGQANTTATNAQSTAQSALSTATTAQSKANEVETELQSFMSEFNLTSTTYNSSSLTITGGTIQGGSITVAKDTSGSIFKVYGYLTISASSNNIKVTINNTGITTDSDYTITPAGFSIAGTLNLTNVDVKNNSIDIRGYVDTASGTKVFVLFPCLYFNKDFGDQD